MAKRDYSMFFESSRDNPSGRKEEFDFWCGTPEGRRAWTEIHKRDGYVSNQSMIDYYLDVFLPRARSKGRDPY